jgi:hypothetical protein
VVLTGLFMKIANLLSHRHCRRLGQPAFCALTVWANSLAYAADMSVSEQETAANTTPAAPAPTTAPSIPIPYLQLPLAFTDFAADFHARELRPQWLTVQVGVLETVFAPPAGKTMFVLPELQQELADNFQPVEISCLVGAKSRFENVTQIDTDPLGHPLGYSLPLGKIVYVLAREEQPAGIRFSFHYYEATQLHWLPNPEKDGWFVPLTQATSMTQDLMVPAEGYVFIFLSNRIGPPHPDSTARPLALYTYLIIHIHRIPQPAQALDAPAAATSSP